MVRLRPRVAALLPALLASVLAACGEGLDTDAGAGRLPQAMILAPGWTTGTTWPSETVLALNSILVRNTAYVEGDVTVIAGGSGTFLSGASRLSVQTNAEITGRVVADSVDMQVAGHVLGAATYNQLTGTGTIDGVKTTSLLVPVSRPVVAASNFSAGTSTITVNAGSTSTRSGGSYGTFNVASGSATNKAVLRLRSGGTFNVGTISLGDYGRIECLGSCEIRVKNRISAGHHSYIGPASGKTMDRVKLFVEGTNGATGMTGPSDLPAAAAFGAWSELKAQTFVPNGTLVLGPSCTGVGKFIAKDVDVGTDTELMSSSSAQRALALQWNVGPTWPNQALVAWNSVDLQSSTSITGDVVVTQNGSGPFLSTAEAALGTNALLTGNLSADRIDLRSGSRVTGTARYNTNAGSGGTAGTLVTPLTLPLDVRVPVFPTITTNSTDYSVPANADRTLAAGRFRTVTVNSGSASDKTVLTLSGGLYEIRTLTLGNHASVVCSAACELRINRTVSSGDGSLIGPATGLDVSRVKLFINQSNSGPTSTPFAASFGTNSRVSAFVFAPVGTVEGQTGAVLSGRFIARNIRVGTSSMTQQAGTTLIAPSITEQPQSVTVLVGQSATFRTVAVGSDVTFQWRRNGVPIAGATAATYTLAAPSLADSGATFTVAVTNQVGSNTSSAATLTVHVCDPVGFVSVPTACGVGACARTGMTQCVAGMLVDSCVAGMAAGSDATCDGVDDDCNGLVDDEYTPEATTCALGACASTGVTSCVAGVEQDSCVSSVPAPDDATCNGFDDDCDGRTDEDFDVEMTSCGMGACAATGVTSCVGGAAYDSCNAGEPDESDDTCNGVDDDCNGEIDDGYDPSPTTCGVGACAATGSMNCVGGALVDSCRAGTLAASDPTCNGVDDDCDGDTDEDYAAPATSCGVGACAATGALSCVDGVVEDTCTAGAPAADDASCNGVDEDCSGTADEDYAPVATSCGVGACAAAGATSCVAGSVQDSCAAGAPASSDATCDGVDDDCSGAADEDYAPLATSCGVGACATTGATSCVSGAVQDSCTAGTPAANDATCNGVDDDCSGTADEDYAPLATSCGVGACTAAGATSCVSGAVHNSCIAGTPAANDAICNGIDDDCSGTADEDYAPLATSCGVGACAATGTTSCVSGAVEDSCTVPTVDADLDGTPDCADGCAGDADKVTPGVCGCGVADTDSDLDSAADCVDVCPFDPYDDVDEDGLCEDADDCPLDPDNDADGDAICGDVDNCPTAANPDQLDSDDDGSGDACDAALMLALAAGGDHSCALMQLGTIRCWGDNSAGQLGTGSTTASASPVLVSGVTDALQVTAGYRHSCALRATGEVVCWGRGSSGQLGNDGSTDALTPVAVSGLDDAVEVDAGRDHSCARRVSGEVVCWGVGAGGELGDGLASNSSVPVPVSGLSDAAQIAIGRAFSCARRDSGELVCWGRGDSGQLGNGATTNASLPGAVTGIADAVELTAGDFHACARRATGEVRCWGYGINGQLGDGTSMTSTTSVVVASLGDAVELDAGRLHTCARLSSGELRCWGDNAYGQLGNGGVASATAPTPVTGIATALEIAAGDLHTCARLASTEVLCWGHAASGQLGQGGSASASSATSVAGITTATEIAAGSFHSCARNADGSASCWGSNQYGEVGNGTTVAATVPAPVSGLSDALSISAGDTHACALRASGGVACWGYGGDGALGNGSTSHALSPVDASSLADAVAVGVGNWHSCAVRDDGSVACWGFGYDGELGDGAFDSSTTPVQVFGLTDAVVVSGGGAHSCALRTGGEAVCWGYGGDGQLGDGTGDDAGTPVAVAGITDAVSLSAGSAHTCVVHAGGTVSCWGANWEGQLGDGTLAASPLPVGVPGLSDALQVDAGSDHTCALRSTGAVVCWGSNLDRQLGDGTSASSSVPVSVDGLSDAVSITTGYAHSCAVTGSGRALCWGDGNSGQLGNGYPQSPLPVAVRWP